jgi:hypothetical protein
LTTLRALLCQPPPSPGPRGGEEVEAPIPALKAAADNPEGTFTSAAAEAISEDGDEETGRSLVPMMTEAVGLLVTAVAGKTHPEAWPAYSWQDPQSGCVSAKSIPKMTMDMSAAKNFKVNDDPPAAASLETLPSTGWPSRLARPGLGLSPVQ